MPLHLDKVIVVDLEATCWNTSPPPGQQSEIIEVGVCLVDVATLQITQNRGMLVLPRTSTLSPFCTRLTSITGEMLAAEGIEFYRACDILKADYASQERLWMSWGNYDLAIFTRQCERWDVPYPFGERHINLRSVFRDFYQLKRGVGTITAMRMLDLIFEGTQHRGKDDARNIARILTHMLKVHGRQFLSQEWK